MSAPQVTLNTIPSNPSLTDALNELRKNIMLSLCAHHIATIQSFDPIKQTATATVNYKKTFFQLDKASGLYNPVLIDYPLLLDCPVIVLGGGATSLSFPIKAGDECLVLFNDRDLDNWFQGSSGGAVATSRFHSFSDGIILVGLRSLANVLTGYDMIRAVLQNGTTVVGVGPSLVKIANNMTTLNTLLQSLVTNIKTLVTQTAAITVTGVTAGGGTSGPPTNAATIAAVSTALTTTASQIAGLLE